MTRVAPAWLASGRSDSAPSLLAPQAEAGQTQRDEPQHAGFRNLANADSRVRKAIAPNSALQVYRVAIDVEA